MKRTIVFVVAILSVLSALAAGPKVVWSNGQVRGDWPKSCVMPDGREVMSPSIETCIESGAARWETDQEQSAREAQESADAQAAAQHEADFSFPSPEVVVPVLNAEGTPTGTARLLVDSSGQIIVVTDTASPQRTAAVQIAEFKAKSAARKSKLTEGKSAAAAANSVPALRAAVAKIVEALE